jgi:hypothetical protein
MNTRLQPLESWHRSSSTRTCIIAMITMVAQKPPLTGAKSPFGELDPTRTRTFYTKAQGVGGLSPSGRDRLKPAPPHIERLDWVAPVQGLCAITRQPQCTGPHRQRYPRVKFGGEVRKSTIGQGALHPSTSSIDSRMVLAAGWPIRISPHMGRLSSQVKPCGAW